MVPQEGQTGAWEKYMILTTMITQDLIPMTASNDLPRDALDTAIFLLGETGWALPTKCIFSHCVISILAFFTLGAIFAIPADCALGTHR